MDQKSLDGRTLPRPAGGAYSAGDPLAGFRGEEVKKGEGEEEKRRKGIGRASKGRSLHSDF